MSTNITEARLREINETAIDRSAMFYWQTDNGITMEERGVLFGSNRDTIDERYLLDQLNAGFNDSDEFHGIQAVGVSDRELFTSQSHVNISALAKLTNDSVVVGRFHPPGVKNGYFSVEEAIISKVQKMGIPVVKHLLTHYGEGPNDLDFFVYEKADGENMQLYLIDHPEEEDDLLYQAGAMMAKIHGVKVTGYGYFDNQRARKYGELVGLHGTYRNHCLAALDANLSDLVGSDHITDFQADKIKSLLKSTDKFNIGAASLVHNDMADWNIIVDGGAISAVIDWDEAHAGDPVADIACWSLFFSEKRLKKFVEGYRTTRELEADFEERLHLYRLRYLVSKLALRHKVYSYKKNAHVEGLIRSGLEALEKESEYFEL